MVVDVEVMSIIRLRKADVLCHSVFSDLLFVCLSVSIIMCDVGMQFCMSRMNQRQHHSMSILQSLQL
jgi:hypothetical protein